jgi:hypothetical protein
MLKSYKDGSVLRRQISSRIKNPKSDNNKNPWPESASKLYQSGYHRLSTKLVPTFADRGCYVVSVTEPYGRILGFLDRSRSRDWVDSVPDLLFFRKSGSAGNRTRISGSRARNSDHYITEVVIQIWQQDINVSCCQHCQHYHQPQLIKADIFITLVQFWFSFEPFNISQPYRPPRSVTGIALLTFFYFISWSLYSSLSFWLSQQYPICINLDNASHMTSMTFVTFPNNLIFPARSC